MSAEYRTWIEMRRRAGNRGNRGYLNYVNVTVDARWDKSFESFYQDVGPRPSSKHSLDRYPNPFGGYEPGNVRWATRKEQGRNKRYNLLVTIGGETRCLSEWAEVKGFKMQTLFRRLKIGWPVERLFDPLLTDTNHNSPLRAFRKMHVGNGRKSKRDKAMPNNGRVN